MSAISAVALTSERNPCSYAHETHPEQKPVTLYA